MYKNILINPKSRRHVILLIVCVMVHAAGTAQVYNEVENPSSPERSRNYDVLHYELSLSVDLDEKYLEGKNKITLTPFDETIDEIKLDAKVLKVTRVSGSDGKDLDYRQTEENVFVKPGKTCSFGDTIDITVDYKLSSPVEGLWFIDAEGDRPKQVSSGCWPNRAREWIPCYDFPNDKFTQDIIVTVDGQYKVLSNGYLVSEHKNEDGTKTWHWRQEKPHPTYLINLSIADYLVVEDSLGDLPVNYWVYQSMANDVERTFAKTPYMIELFNRIYNYEYPWVKYDQVISGYIGGGAEATSATLLGEGIVMDEYSAQDYSREKVIAHEVAHQWWGDLITCRSWEHTWLNESFGTYSDHLYTKYDEGKDAGDYDLLRKKISYFNEVRDNFMRPMVYTDYDHPGDNFNRHTYQKGACLLNLLQNILGEEVFFRVISEFLHRYEFQAVGTSDFMTCVKEVSGKNMDWFFEQYFYQPGHAVLQVEKKWNDATKELEINIVQEQDKWEDVPVYEMPLRLGFYWGDKKEIQEYWISEKSETIKIRLDKKPDMVRFDEGNLLIKEWTYEKDLEELLFQVDHDDVPGRLWALDQLSEYAQNPEVLSLWKRVASNDGFWAVRALAMELVAKHKGTDEIEFIKDRLNDKSSKVRTAAVKSLGELKQSSLRGFYKDVFQSDNSYAVQSEALRALGKCGKSSDIGFLKKAGEHKSYRNVIRRASEQAVEYIESL